MASPKASRPVESRRVAAMRGLLLFLTIGLMTWVIRSDWFFLLTHRARPDDATLKQAFPGGSHTLLDSTPQLTLFSLDSHSMGASLTGPRSFHGWRVMGRTQLAGGEKAKLLAVLSQSMVRDDDEGIAPCFSPRHGIRVKQGSNKLDLVICFHCHSLETYAAAGKGGCYVGPEAQPYFDAILRRAGVPLSPH